ncbi:MAG: helicase-related protein [Parvibaculales bacterium]
MPQSDSLDEFAHTLIAVLGPTNTGKTHLAIDRMLGYETGMIGLPLRLLAREIYDRITAKIGAGEVALVTGEEKIIPKRARYYICTIEAMPLSRSVDFIAIDEIQLCADPERGYIFTDRLLHARGRHQTMLLGAATMRPLVKHLLPKAHIMTRPRFSELRYAGSKKISRLPRRTAITAFSADNVYAIAQLIRQQKGGAAVVMGALSPRTRNAQVAMYQSGEVDFLVATDAIGMGLNMDVDHVAFAQTRKFDGRRHRALMPAELAQIAGRAGRHTSDGTFGVTGEVSEFDPELVEQIENHEFEAVKSIMWRNPNLDFTNLASLKLSLEAPSPRKGLVRAPVADDLQALTLMSTDPALVDRISGEARLRLLWEIAQTPDYRKTMASEHAALLSEIFMFLTGPDEKIPVDWLDERIRRCDNTKGDLDTLSARLAHIRTWTYVSQKTAWIDDPVHWQNRARDIEDKLSDAVHEGLMKQFVDPKSSALMRRLQGKEEAEAHIDDIGDVYVEGEYAGHIAGLQFQRDPRLSHTPARAVRSALDKLSAAYLRQQAEALANAPDAAFSLNLNGQIMWNPACHPDAGAAQGADKGSEDLAQADTGADRTACVGKMRSGKDRLRPTAILVAEESLNGAPRQAAEKRITDWLRLHLDTALSPLAKLRDAEDLSGLARGLAFQLVEQGGSTARLAVQETVTQLDQPARATLRKYGVRFGAYNIFLPALLKPAAARLLAQLWCLENGRLPEQDFSKAPAESLTSADRQKDLPNGFYRSLGFFALGRRIVRLDMLERLADLVRAEQEKNATNKTQKNTFQINADMLSLMGCGEEDMAGILSKLGYKSRQVDPAPDANGDTAEPTPPADSPDAQDMEANQPPPDQPANADSTNTTSLDEAPALQIWWHYAPHKARGKNRKPAAGKSGKGKTRSRKPNPGQTTAKPPKAEDSPFAALAALKQGQDK